MSRTLRNAVAAVWLVVAAYLGAIGSDPAFTMGAIVCATVWAAS